jgi:hypothetical protein
LDTFGAAAASGHFFLEIRRRPPGACHQALNRIPAPVEIIVPINWDSCPGVRKVICGRACGGKRFDHESPWHSERDARNRPRHRLRSIRETFGWRRLPAPPCSGSPAKANPGPMPELPESAAAKVKKKPKSMTHRRIEVSSSETICRTAKNFLANLSPLKRRIVCSFE